MQKINCPDCDTSNLANARFCAGCGHQLPQVQPVVTEAAAAPPVSKKRPSQRNKIIAALAVGIVFWGIVYMVQRTYLKPYMQEKVLQIAAAQANQQCPMMADEVTRMDSVAAGPGNVLHSYFTLMDVSRAQVDTTVFLQRMEVLITENVRANEALKIYRASKTTMTYSYNDSAGNFIAGFSVTPEMYE